MNPEFLLCDTDALIQVLMSRQGILLTRLKSDFKVRAAAIPEIEMEIRNHRKFRDEFAKGFKQYADSGTITRFDSSESKNLLTSRNYASAQISPEVARIQSIGDENNRTVDLGEAYVHATAVVLHLPVLSHDFSALRMLADPKVGVPTLRFFDLVVFGFGQGWIDNDDGERIVKVLKDREEWLPKPFDGHDEFSDCCHAFNSRLAYAPAGSSPAPPRTFSDTLTLVAHA